MRAIDLILKKRNGGELTGAEIEFFIDGYTRGQLPDYQAAAWLMAVFFQGMTSAETVALTMAMVRSGKQLDLSEIAPIVADKHSTGGVGDKTTMVVAPLVAATGLPVGKMSGRGLGYFGGTVDKLETIPGFKAELTDGQFREAEARVGLVVTGQSGELAPADGKFYALRDVTGTVESLPLIASSIMSKKIAAGANCIVLDVKHGKGAFMKSLDEAVALAEAMAAIGRGVGRKVKAVLSSMDQPLGFAVGNTLEVAEAIKTLQGEGPADLLELAYILGGQLLIMAGRAENDSEARHLLKKVLDSGEAFAKYKAFIANQGGDTRVLDNPALLPQAPFIEGLVAREGGFIKTMDAEIIGIAAHELGAGRKTKTDLIDPAVGLVLNKKIGDKVEVGEPLLQIYGRTKDGIQNVRESLLGAFTFSQEPVQPPPLIDRIV